MSQGGWGLALQIIGDIGEGVSSAVGAGVAKKRTFRALDKAGKEVTMAFNEATKQYEPYAETGGQFFKDLASGVKSGEFDSPLYQGYNSGEAQPTAPGAETYGTQPGQYQTPQFDYQKDPGYQAQLQAGNQQIQGAAGGSGMLLSGATQKALARYGVGLAAQDYQKSFDRYVNQRDFGYGMSKDNLTQFNANRTSANQMYELGLGQYNRNREFGQSENLNEFNSKAQQVANRYNQYGSLANVGMAATDKQAELGTNLGVALANLELQRGQTDAATAINAGQATGGVFNKVSQFGAGMTGGGGQSGSSNGGSGISLDFLSKMGGQSGMAAKYGAK